MALRNIEKRLWFYETLFVTLVPRLERRSTRLLFNVALALSTKLRMVFVSHGIERLCLIQSRLAKHPEVIGLQGWLTSTGTTLVYEIPGVVPPGRM